MCACIKDHEQALRRQGQLAQQLLATRIQLAQLQHGGAIGHSGGGDDGDSFVGSNSAGGRHGEKIHSGGSHGGGEAVGGLPRRTDAQQMCRRLLEANAMLMRRLEREAGATDENSDTNAR